MKKTTKATARKKINMLEIDVPRLVNATLRATQPKPKVTVHKVSEIYKLEMNGYKLFVELDDNTITIKNICGSGEFVFDTVRNPVTKERWQAIARLITEATELI